MIQELMFVNPITNLEEVLKINIGFNSKDDWLQETNNCNEHNNFVRIIELLDVLDCTHFKNKPTILPGYFGYDYYLGLCMFHILREDYYEVYNILVDRLIKLHCNNLEFAHSYFPPAPAKDKTESTRKKRKQVKNEYVRYISKDLFDGRETYTYVNHYTGDEFDSDNPDLLDKLNAVKPKKVKSKNKVVSFDSITFNFNIKK